MRYKIYISIYFVSFPFCKAWSIVEFSALFSLAIDNNGVELALFGEKLFIGLLGEYISMSSFNVDTKTIQKITPSSLLMIFLSQNKNVITKQLLFRNSCYPKHLKINNRREKEAKQ